jgi:CheY-like chemotaxis protein
VVEDNKTNQLIAKSLLEPVGFRVWLGNDGQEGIDLFKTYQDDIDLVLMDLHMPILNGYEAAQKIREISPVVPIVAMTADVIQGVKEKCEAAGIHHYISKPFDPEQFVEIISEIIRATQNIESKPEVVPVSETTKKDEADTVVLDRQQGLSYMGNNKTLYERVLKAYFEENQEINISLTAAIKNKCYEEAIQMVHKVKSSAGSIGAMQVFQIAMNLQKALEEPSEEEIARLYPQFIKAMDALLEDIEKS